MLKIYHISSYFQQMKLVRNDLQVKFCINKLSDMEQGMTSHVIFIPISSIFVEFLFAEPPSVPLWTICHQKVEMVKRKYKDISPEKCLVDIYCTVKGGPHCLPSCEQDAD